MAALSAGRASGAERMVCVTSKRRTTFQKSWVRKKFTTSANEPPRISDARYNGAAIWNMGRVTSVRSDGNMELLGMKVDHTCNADDSTPLDGPVVPDV